MDDDLSPASELMMMLERDESIIFFTFYSHFYANSFLHVLSIDPL